MYRRGIAFCRLGEVEKAKEIFDEALAIEGLAVGLKKTIIEGMKEVNEKKRELKAKELEMIKKMIPVKKTPAKQSEKLEQMGEGGFIPKDKIEPVPATSFLPARLIILLFWISFLPMAMGGATEKFCCGCLAPVIRCALFPFAKVHLYLRDVNEANKKER